MGRNPYGENDFHPVRFMEAGIRLIGEGENEKRYELSFSSEEPYNRWYGIEILDHTEGCMDLNRLQSLGVVLFNHKMDRVIGKIIKAWNEDGRGKAIIEFDDDNESEIIRKKVASGTLKGVSVGYNVDVWEEVAAGKSSSDGRFNGPCYIAKKWIPLEISIVSVPADPTVGVGRSQEEITGENLALMELSIYEKMVQTNENLLKGEKDY